jgi:hypothetical protein
MERCPGSNQYKMLKSNAEAEDLSLGLDLFNLPFSLLDPPLEQACKDTELNGTHPEALYGRSMAKNKSQISNPSFTTNQPTQQQRGTTETQGSSTTPLLPGQVKIKRKPAPGTSSNSEHYSLSQTRSPSPSESSGSIYYQNEPPSPPPKQSTPTPISSMPPRVSSYQPLMSYYPRSNPAPPQYQQPSSIPNSNTPFTPPPWCPSPSQLHDPYYYPATPPSLAQYEAPPPEPHPPPQLHQYRPYSPSSYSSPISGQQQQRYPSPVSKTSSPQTVPGPAYNKRTNTASSNLYENVYDLSGDDKAYGYSEIEARHELKSQKSFWKFGKRDS